MHSVEIVGAGELGGTIAHALARRDAVGAITLVDETGRVAAGKALDIAQAAPVEGFATELTGTTDLSNAAGAAVVVIADRVTGGEWQGEDALMLLKRLTQTASRAVIVCAGASARELVDLGVPPDHIVIPWEDATVGGFGLTRLVDEPARRRLRAKVPALWPPGPHALAAAAVKAIESMAGRQRQMVSCFVAPDTSAGVSSRTAALPVRLEPAGIVAVVIPELSVVERVALDNAMAI